MAFGKVTNTSVTPWSFTYLGKGESFIGPTDWDLDKENGVLGYVGFRVFYQGKPIAQWLNWQVRETKSGGIWASAPNAYYGQDEDGEHVRYDSFILDDETAMKLAREAARTTYNIEIGEEADTWVKDLGGPEEDIEALF